MLFFFTSIGIRVIAVIAKHRGAPLFDVGRVGGVGKLLQAHPEAHALALASAGHTTPQQRERVAESTIAIGQITARLLLEAQHSAVGHVSGVNATTDLDLDTTHGGSFLGTLCQAFLLFILSLFHNHIF